MIEILRAQRAIIAENLEKWDRMIAEEEQKQCIPEMPENIADDLEPLGACV